jgi:hypothetical protein
MKRRRNRLAATRRVGVAILGLAGALLLSDVTLADGSASAAAPPTAGSWQSHKYSFQFLGFTTTYSCDGLADKLRILLLAAGARSDLKSHPGACASGFGRPDKFARADVTFYTLAPADTNTAAGAKPVNGVWRSVSLGAHSPRELAIGDCELVEQFRNQLLPMFAARNIIDNMTCIPHQDSGSTIDLRFDAFAAAPPKKSEAVPASGGG